MRGSEGAAGQATLKEAAVAKKKKRAEKAQRRQAKEKEIARRVRASENRSDMDADLELEEPIEMGGNTSTSKDDGDRGVIMTLVERCMPAADPIGGGQDTERRNDIPTSWKRAASSNTAVERDAKRE